MNQLQPVLSSYLPAVVVVWSNHHTAQGAAATSHIRPVHPAFLPVKIQGHSVLQIQGQQLRLPSHGHIPDIVTIGDKEDRGDARHVPTCLLVGVQLVVVSTVTVVGARCVVAVVRARIETLTLVYVWMAKNNRISKKRF